MAVTPDALWSVPAPRSVLVVSSKNSTLPVGVPELVTTVAVKVTGIPYVTVACDVVTVVDEVMDGSITPVVTGTKVYE